MRLVVAIPVKNEQRHILRVYENALRVSSSIYFFDSDSSDDTVKLIQSTSATLVSVPPGVASFSQKLNYIYSYPEFVGSLVLALHADELIEQASIPHLLRLVATASPHHVFLIKRQSYFLGFTLRWGKSSQYSARLAGFGMVRYEDALLDEKILPNSKTSPLVLANVRIIDNPLITPHEWLAKHNLYSTLEAKSISCGAWNSKPLNVKLYYSLPLFIRPFLLFAFRYVLLLGFLDGLAGFLYQVSHSIVYRLMVDIKLFHHALSSFQSSDLRR